VSQTRKPESNADKKARAGRIAKQLRLLYPEARISLNFETPWQCLVATILSAQCTDERVNQVTPILFSEIPTVEAMARADENRVRELIMTTGFFRQKTKSIQGAARALIERFGGELPDRMEALLTIPGVGRKTANVVLGHVFGKPGLVVDTHVKRLALRLGFTRSRDPREIEGDLQKLLRDPQWTPFSMRLILHGRRVCFARRPRCESCRLNNDCPRVGVKTAAA
jgi:endonuclease-3